MTSNYKYVPEEDIDSLISFIENDFLPSIIFQLAEVIGKKKAIYFYLANQEKRVYIPKTLDRNSKLYDQLSCEDMGNLIALMPGLYLDFRRRTTNLESAFKIAHYRKHYQQALQEFQLRFKLQNKLSKQCFNRVISSP